MFLITSHYDANSSLNTSKTIVYHCLYIFLSEISKSIKYNLLLTAKSYSSLSFIVLLEVVNNFQWLDYLERSTERAAKRVYLDDLATGDRFVILDIAEKMK